MLKQDETEAKKPTRILYILFVVFGVAIAASVILGQPNTVTPTAEQVAAQKATADKESTRAKSVGMAARYLRASMRNPASLVWESAQSNDDGSIICFAYRAQNGFGGMNREYALFNGIQMSNRIEDLNKLCPSATIDSMSDVKFYEEDHFLLPVK